MTDNLGGRFLKDGATALSVPVAQVINLSIKSSALVPKNYRPISLLPLLSKLFEKIIHMQTQDYLIENNILYKYQSGFDTKHSTDTCLSLLNDRILTGIDKEC